GLLDKNADIEVRVVSPDVPVATNGSGHTGRSEDIPGQDLSHIGGLSASFVEVDLVDPLFVGVEQKRLPPIELKLAALGGKAAAAAHIHIVVKLTQKIDRCACTGFRPFGAGVLDKILE